MIPKAFENETDYRKIPREYLETNIPRGRGSVKWQRTVIYMLNSMNRLNNL